MKMYRCRICGETYLGSEVPSHCPFCGAHAEHLVPSAEYPPDINEVRLTEVERRDIEAAIELERSNARFYFGMAQHKDDPVLSSAYKRLGKVEAEHCELFCKLVDVDEPADLNDPMDDVTADWCANIEDSIAREQRASRFYAEVVERATSERIKEVFAAVSDVEADHIVLDQEAQRHAGCV